MTTHNRACQCCKAEEAIWAWQPLGPDPDPASYTTLGSHYRGFPVIKVCDSCKTAFESGKEVSFTYKGTCYVGKDRQVYKAGELPLEDGGPKISTDLAEAAMERGETVRIECEPFPVDPYLIQLALDLQAKQKLEEWRQAQEPSPVPEENKPQHPFTFIAHLLTLAFDALHETQESTTFRLSLDPWFCSIIIGRACVCLVKYYRDSDWEVSNTCF